MPLTVLATLPLPAQHEAELRELNAEVSTLQFDGIIENELPSWNAAMITSAAFRPAKFLLVALANASFADGVRILIHSKRTASIST
eukprot:6201889-Pleurochrysis_carterae.AAC.1